MVFIIFFLLLMFPIILWWFWNALRQGIRLILSAYRLPGPPYKNIFFGNSYENFLDPDGMHNRFVKWNTQYYPIYKIWAFHKHIVTLLDPIDVEAILVNSVHHKKSQLYNLLNSWLKTGLLTSSGEKWHTRRKILTPTFHFAILEKFTVIFNEEIQNLVVRINHLLANGSEVLNVYKLIKIFTLKAMGQTAMGTKLGDGNTQIERDYISSIEEISNVLLHRVNRPWLRLPLIYKWSNNFYKEMHLVQLLHKFTRSIITKRRLETNESEGIGNSNRKRLAMLDLLLSAERENRIDEDGICEEVDTFMFEGHDTTSMAISHALMLIANHPDIQEKLLDEIQSVLGPNLQTGTITIAQLQNLTYMEMCIKETLRLYPSVYFISRELGEDFKTNSGYLLPKGSQVLIHIESLQRNPLFYPNPNKFDPERFLPEYLESMEQFAYIPFSAGSRNCIGKRFAMLEMKMVLAGIISNFILYPIDKPDTLTFLSGIILKATNEVQVKFAPRNRI